MDYWSRLKHLQMYSQQRRAERYRIIYTWKVLEGIVPTCGSQHNVRGGWEFSIPPLKGKASIQTLGDQSFQVNRTRLFHSLPRNLKKKLDEYLATLPDI